MENNNQHNHISEQELLDLIEAVSRGEKIDASDTHAEQEEFLRTIALLHSARASVTPPRELLTQIFTAMSSEKSTPVSVPSPYISKINQLFSQLSSFKVATPVMIFLFALATIIGVSQKKAVAPLAPILSAQPEEHAFTVTSAIAPDSGVVPSLKAPVILMSKMSQATTVDSTPSNVSELIAMLSSEADQEVVLGGIDVSDPLLSIDSALLGDITQIYDVSTI